MKKIIAITAMAAAVAGFSFADEPVADVKVAEFTGNAAVTWGVDLDDGGTGFKNEAESTLKLNLLNKGDKSTEGDGIWGEVKIEATQGFQFKSAAAAEGAEGSGFDFDGDNRGKVKVSAAKLHFGPVYVGIMSGDTKVGAYKIPNAIMSADNDNALRLTDVGATATQGIVAGYGDDNFGIDVDFRSVKGTTGNANDYYSNNYAIAAEAKLKDTNAFVPGLSADVGFAMPFASNAVVAASANAGYKLKMGDTYYLNPTVGWEMTTDTGTPMSLVGGVLFGWGATADANAGVPYLDGDFAKKVTPGVGVAVKLDNLTNNDTRALTVVPSFYSGDLIPNLKIGAAAEISTLLTSGATLNLGVAGGAKYTIAVGDSIKISPYAGARFMQNDVRTSVFWQPATTTAPITPAQYRKNDDNGGKSDTVRSAEAGKNDTILNIKAGCEFAGLISNTTFDVYYQSRNLTNTTDYSADNAAKAVIGTINLKCKISF